MKSSLRHCLAFCLLACICAPLGKLYAAPGTFANFSCPAPQVKQIVQSNYVDNVYGPHCAEHGGPAPQVMTTSYSSPATWANAIAAYCDGSTWGNSVVWSMPPYACGSTGGLYCLNASVDGGPTGIYANGYIGCGTGFLVARPPPLPPPPTGNNCCSTASNSGMKSAGEPIEVSAGNEFARESDYQSGDGRLRLVRAYNSSVVAQTALSTGWQTNFDAGIVVASTLVNTSRNGLYVSGVYSTPDTACSSGWAQIASTVSGLSTTTASYINGVCTLSTGQTIPVYASDPINARSTTTTTPYLAAAVRPNGEIYYFTCSAGTCQANSDIALRLSLAAGGGFTLLDENDTTEQYDSTGALISITQRNGYQQLLSRTSEQLNAVTDSLGRSLTFSYNSDGSLHSVTTPDGAVVYGYDSSSRLASVLYPDGNSRVYSYSNGQYVFALTGITDENSSNYESWSYDTLGRAYANSLAGGVNAISVQYN
ncbi:MAG TPA: DUF6531 domain-containing protein, partial [Verrucomicrobiae bacterium]|nr:DUF6531 domain-containing protein [Verrucomicrobiae bacterium]